MNTRKRIEKIIDSWFLTQPFLFEIYCTHQLRRNTLEVPLRSGNGVIEYDETICQYLNDNELHEYLKMEMYRIALRHPYQRQPASNDKIAIYIASTITIMDCCSIDLELALPEDYGFESNLTFEEYYKLLHRDTDLDTQEDLSQDDRESFDTDYNDSNVLESYEDGIEGIKPKDDDVVIDVSIHYEDGDYIKPRNIPSHTWVSNFQSSKKYSNALCKKSVKQQNFLNSQELQKQALSNIALWQEDDCRDEIIKTLIEKAITQKTWGSIPANFIELLEVSLKCRIDYRRCLSMFRHSILSSTRKPTRLKPSRRYGFQYMGSKYDFTTQLLIAVDVSGSVSSDTLQRFFSIVNRFFKYRIEKLDVITFDTELKGEVMSLKKAKNTIEIIGRGGTNFQPAIDYFEEHKNYDGLIIFSDGYAPMPNVANNRRKLWVFGDIEQYNDFMKNPLPLGSKCTYII